MVRVNAGVDAALIVSITSQSQMGHPPGGSPPALKNQFR
jgi:hypothetical protein